MHAVVTVLGAGAADGGGPAVLLQFEDVASSRYLFNCGEGMQRLCGQHGLKLANLKGIFLTRLDWSHVGGLPGLICTLADYGSSPEETNLTICGPVNTCHFIATLRPFLKRNTFSLSINEAVEDSELLYSDGQITVKAIEVQLSSHDKRMRYSPEIGASVHPRHVLLSMFKKKSSETACCEERVEIEENQRLPLVQARTSALSLSIRGPLIPGKFDARKARQLGVPFGPLNGQLIRGETVELPDGRQVLPSDCVGPPTPGPVMLLLDCPSEAFIMPLATMLPSLIEDQLNLVLHVTYRAIYESPVYKEQIRAGLPGIRHVLIPLDHNDQLLFTSKADQQLQLNHLDSELYRIPFWDNREASALNRIRWSPPGREHDTISFEIPTIAPKKQAEHPSPHFAFLGTGAALPGKYRNVSATLVHLESESVLLDCGEATCGQLRRFYGPDLADKALQNMIVLISHLHADHQLGFLGLLKRRRELGYPGPFKLIAPMRYRQFLEEYGQCIADDISSSFDFTATEDILEGIELNGISFKSVPVIHCPAAFGYVVRRNDLQVVYSGDTRPCSALAEAALEGAPKTTLLIHEATFEDALAAEAKSKRHSTIGEAIEIGIAMNADYTLLTHISQRAGKMHPSHNWERDNLCIPMMDFMAVSLEHLQRLDQSQIAKIVTETNILLGDKDQEE